MSEPIVFPLAHNFKNFTGQKFGQLTVLGYAGKVGKKNECAWNVRCACGREKVVPAKYLYRVVSCGCLRRAAHGHAKGRRSDTYSSWHSMIKRCRNPKATHYDLYGGRGIKVCERWQSDFAAFLADMGERPGKKFSIDRFPNKNGNYEPGNCRWATRSEQQNNRRDTYLLTYQGRTQGIAQWSREVGINLYTIRSRVESGMSVEEALTKPVG